VLGTTSGQTAVGDFVFYGSFGLVVTSSVAHAGVLLVFSFLIIPAIIGTLASQRSTVSLLIGWLSGSFATLVGLAASVMWDTPTGPTMVVCFAAVLLLAVPILAGFRRLRTGRSLFGRQIIFGGLGLACLAVFTQGGWLMMAPRADQPLLSALEQAVGIGPEFFMTPTEQAVYRDAAAVEEGHRIEVERLRDAERKARWQGRGLSEEELRRVASYQQTFSEMSRGERFVQTQLLAKARERQVWRVGLPAVLGSLLALTALLFTRERLSVARGEVKCGVSATGPQERSLGA
jgi:zinc/manganese transport system permease protein